MIIPNENLLCEQSKLYYYDFLFQQNKSQIPEHITNHLKQCNNCQKQIYELKKVLTQTELKSQQSPDKSVSSISKMLKLHFSYVDKKTTCKIVKPFLPGLLDESLQISIPTPITAHLDHCPECVKDIGIINDLCLSDVQLFRLSRLFTAKNDDDNISCSKAKTDIFAFVMMAFHESEEQVLKHLCSCSECRSAIYQYRQATLTEYLNTHNQKICFESSHFSNEDIFDFAIPYGLDIDEYRKSESLQSRASHIRRCPFCLERIQELHETVYDIAERPNSEIVTIYNVEETAQIQSYSDSQDIYVDFPVRVETIHNRETINTGYAGSIINFTAALRKRVFTPNIKNFSRAGLVAFAMVAILTTMLFYSPAAKALSLEKLCSTLENIDYVYISTFISDQKEPYQEQWISRSSNIQIIKTGNDLVLRDINNKKLIEKTFGNDYINNKQEIPDELLKDYKESLHYFGLTPFNSVSNISQNYQWNHITTESENSLNDTTEIYELIYEDTTSGSSGLMKYRFFLKNSSQLPSKIEVHRKLWNESEYSLLTTKIVEYNINDNEILSIKESMFPSASLHGQP